MNIILYNRYLFMLLETEEIIAQGFLGIIEYFEWKRVSIVVQDETVFTAVRNVYSLDIQALSSHETTLPMTFNSLEGRREDWLSFRWLF